MIHSQKISLVLLCIDYRFWPQALPILKEKYGDFDLIEIAGSSKNITSPLEEEDKIALIENIGISIKLHHPHKIILTNHTDCGAYGGSKKFKSHEEEIDFHKGELMRAKKIVEEKFPDFLVETELFTLNGEKVVLVK